MTKWSRKMSRYYCGIDPGYKTGGVALVNGDWAEVHDLPVWSEGGVNTLELSHILNSCLLYTSPSPRDVEESRMPSSA